MTLTISFEVYRSLTKEERNDGVPITAKIPRFSISAEDEQHSIYIFHSDGTQTKETDFRFATIRAKDKHGSRYTWLNSTGKSKRVMARPVAIYSDQTNIDAYCQHDVALIKRVISAVTSTPVSFPINDEREGLICNKVTVTIP